MVLQLGGYHLSIRWNDYWRSTPLIVINHGFLLFIRGWPYGYKMWMEQKFCSTNSMRKVMGKPGKPGKPFKTSRFSATNRDSPVPCRHGAINHPQAALAMWPWRSPIGMAITNNGVFTWHSPIFLSPCLLITDLRNILLYKYMHNTFTYAYIHIRSIYIYIYTCKIHLC